MRLVPEIMKRKTALEAELRFLNDMLMVCQASLDRIDGTTPVLDAMQAGIISVRVGNVTLNTLVSDYNNRGQLTLREMVNTVLADEKRFLQGPNFGRKSLNEIRLLAARLI